MKKICFITGSRADYGILAPIMKEIKNSHEAELQIVATNMHLSPSFGMTVNEIESDGFTVNYKLTTLEEGGTAASTVKSMAKVMDGLAEALDQLKPDLVVILGDRYEALAAASSAVVFNIPIVHLHGGETSEGAIDDLFRHAITKLSTYHFASTPQYRDKIISMGEKPENVFHSGAPGAEGIDTTGKEQDFYDKTGLYPYEPFIILAMHPVTVLPDKGKSELKTTLEALDEYIKQGYKILVTMPNSDPGNKEFREIINEWAESELRKERVITVESLGSNIFHYAMDHASAMIGNSSAALIEAPTYRLPVVNVGIRQKGRAHGMTVIDTTAEKGRILNALSAALSLEMKSVLLGLTISSLNPYYKADSVKFIAEKIMNLS